MFYLVTQMLLCLLIAFLLGLWVGWWLGRRRATGAAAGGAGDDLERCRRELAGSRTDLEACRRKLEECRGKLEACEAAADRAAPVAFADTAAAGPAPAEEPLPSDDLTRIEGIGPKIEGLLNAEGVTTWARLAETEVGFLQSVLDRAGPRYRIHDPATWPRQAALAAAGSWDELDELQERLKGGRED